MNWIARWEALRKMSNVELMEEYRRSLEHRPITDVLKAANLRAFPKVKEREQKIYFIITNEQIAESIRLRGAGNNRHPMDGRLNVYRPDDELPLK